MFENRRRRRQARNFTTNAPKILDLKSSSEQIFSRKLPLGAPDESVSISLSHDYTTSAKAAGGFKQLHNNLCMSFWMASEGIVFLYCSYVCNCAKIPNFANCRFSFHKLQIFISFRFAPFRFANYTVSLASEVLKPPHFASNFGCFQVADHENWFCRFSPNPSGLLKNKPHTAFSYLLISMYGQDMTEIEFLTVAAGWSIFTDIRS